MCLNVLVFYFSLWDWFLPLFGMCVWHVFIKLLTYLIWYAQSINQNIQRDKILMLCPPLLRQHTTPKKSHKNLLWKDEVTTWCGVSVWMWLRRGSRSSGQRPKASRSWTAGSCNRTRNDCGFVRWQHFTKPSQTLRFFHTCRQVCRHNTGGHNAH